MSRTQVICAIAVGTIAMVVVALSYAVGLNPLRSSVDAQDPGPQAAQIAGLDVIDAADADFLLLGGPIQAAFVPDTDEQLAFPVNVLASADPDTGGLGFLITDPLAETFPLYGAGDLPRPVSGGRPVRLRPPRRPYLALAGAGLCAGGGAGGLRSPSSGARLRWGRHARLALPGPSHGCRSGGATHGAGQEGYKARGNSGERRNRLARYLRTPPQG